jgi:hypothetical protein
VLGGSGTASGLRLGWSPEPSVEYYIAASL